MKSMLEHTRLTGEEFVQGLLPYLVAIYKEELRFTVDAITIARGVRCDSGRTTIIATDVKVRHTNHATHVFFTPVRVRAIRNIKRSTLGDLRRRGRRMLWLRTWCRLKDFGRLDQRLDTTCLSRCRGRRSQLCATIRRSVRRRTWMGQTARLCTIKFRRLLSGQSDQRERRHTDRVGRPLVRMIVKIWLKLSTTRVDRRGAFLLHQVRFVARRER